MRLYHVLTAALGVCAISSACAQENWAGVTIPNGNGWIITNTGPNQPKTQLNGSEAINASCFSVASFPTGSKCPSGIQQDAFIPLSEFARSSTVEKLRDQIAALSVPSVDFTQLQNSLNGLRDDVDVLSALPADFTQLQNSLALASALDIVLPPDGQSNRLGFSVSHVADRQAVGLSYGHVSGDFDFGASVAFTEGDVAGKVAAGYSW